MISIARKHVNSWVLEYQLLLSIVLFNIVDFLTTNILLSRLGGLEHEGNALLSITMKLMESIWAIVMVKVIMISIAWGIMYWFFNPTKHHSVKFVLMLVLSAYIGVSIFNYGLVFMT